MPRAVRYPESERPQGLPCRMHPWRGAKPRHQGPLWDYVYLRAGAETEPASDSRAAIPEPLPALAEEICSSGDWVV